MVLLMDRAFCSAVPVTLILKKKYVREQISLFFFIAKSTRFCQVGISPQTFLIYFLLGPLSAQ